MLLAACSNGDPCFPPQSLIIDPRVVAIRVDPPESTIDLTGNIPMTPSTIAVLALTGEEDHLLQYGRAVQVTGYRTTISICLLPPISNIDAEPGCPAASEVVAVLDAIPSAQAPLSYSPPLSLLQAAVDQDPLHGLTGVQLRLQFAIEAAPTLIATKTLDYQLAGSKVTLNHGLEITGMETSYLGEQRSFAIASPGLSQPIPLVVAKTTGLRPLIGPGIGGTSAAESYSTYDDKGQLITLLEQVSYSFYGGNALFFGKPEGPTGIAAYTGAPSDVADEPPPGSPDPPYGLVSCEPVFPNEQTGTFWVVARDGRGAESWLQVAYEASDPRNCMASGAQCPEIYFGCN